MAIVFVACALGGCERTDYKGVTFKPKEADLQAYRTSLVVMIVRRSSAERLLGVGGTWRAQGILREGWTPLLDKGVVINGAELVPVDERGIARRDELTAGGHSLEVVGLARQGDSSGAPCRKGATCQGCATCGGGSRAPREYARPLRESSFFFPIVAVKDKMTVALVVIGEKSRRVYVQTMAFDFILERVLRTLARRAQTVDRLIDGLSGMYCGQTAAARWPELFVAGSRDAVGGLDDYLQAQRFRVDTGRATGTSLVAALVTFGDEHSVLQLQLIDQQGRADFERFVITSGHTGRGGWRVASRGVDPKRGGF